MKKKYIVYLPKLISPDTSVQNRDKNLDHWVENLKKDTYSFRDGNKLLQARTIENAKKEAQEVFIAYREEQMKFLEKIAYTEEKRQQLRDTYPTSIILEETTDYVFEVTE